MEKIQAFREELETAVTSGDKKGIQALFYRVGELVLEDGDFPKGCFEAVICSLREKRFIDIKGSWTLLKVFEDNWDSLSEQQRVELLPELERAYKSFNDWKACFVISGILGEQYNDQRAFAALCRLSACTEEMQRSMIPHGFEHIVSGSLDPGLANLAVAELERMEHDQSQAVRSEAKESLARLKRASTTEILGVHPPPQETLAQGAHKSKAPAA